MVDAPRPLDEPLIAQVMNVYGPCTLLRLYDDTHLQLEPSAASRLVLLNLGPAHVLLESVTLGWFDGGTDRTTYFPFGTVIVPGEGKDLLSVDALPEIMALMGSPLLPGLPGASRAFRVLARVVVPGEILTVAMIVKPLAVAPDGSGYFGVVVDYDQARH
ncbi:hypothetical protein HNQ07_001243 [Deinococcus metalli]|uniref:Uncharacterized protein n=1 Tax=Deinococcus metalli TaxID=1141878 RepID=A0A7W8NNI2_9DEIO|nr:hypothetical protein [Deinococcus metalli]MBB5375786.1 hypothetical protein [Deinococcus metalli]GHF37057.1 hypothetical protein GCM10017781_12170 [Deinococcus metalli]